MYEAEGTGHQGMYEASGQATKLDLNEYRDRKITKNTFLDDSFRKNRESSRRYGKTQLGGAGRQGTYEARGAGQQGTNEAEGTRRPGKNKDGGAGRQGTHEAGGAGRQGKRGTYEDGGAGRQDTRAATNFYEAGTKQGDFYQAGTKQGIKDDDEDASDSRPEVIVADTGGRHVRGRGRRASRRPPTSTRPGPRRASRSQGEGGGDDREGRRPETFYYRCLVDVNLTLPETALF